MENHVTTSVFPGLPSDWLHFYIFRVCVCLCVASGRAEDERWSSEMFFFLWFYIIDNNSITAEQLFCF